jgi:short subunit dehydrogenase-like uncharacterized protein
MATTTTTTTTEKPKSDKFLIYGATGYMGRLMLEQYFQRGGNKEKVIIGGRNASKVMKLSRQYGVNYRVFDLKFSGLIDQNIQDVFLVLLLVTLILMMFSI